MPNGHEDHDDRFLALAALLMAGMDAPRKSLADLEAAAAEPPPAPVDDLASRRQKRSDEHALARSRHPSSRKARQSA